LIQTVRAEQFIARAKASARSDDWELLDSTHKNLTRSMKKLRQSIVRCVKRSKAQDRKLRKDLDELVRLWHLEPLRPGELERSTM
jgi:hypothetical protein